jgi:membrane fusion protein, multidrug efflux system
MKSGIRQPRLAQVGCLAVPGGRPPKAAGQTLRHQIPAALSLLLSLATPAQAQYALEHMEMRAQLSPQRYTTLSAELGAKIDRLTVKEGERFKTGQLLIQFDCTLQKAQLDKAKAQQIGAENTFAGNQRLAELNAVGQVELKNAEAEVLKARADVAYLQATLDKCSIIAPFDGRASEQKAREHQFVQPGQPLLDIIDDSTLELEFIVPSRWLVWLKPGHKFSVRIEDTSKTYPVRLLRIAARADPVSQSVKAVAVIDGHYPELIAGMSGRILLSPDSARRGRK